MIERDIASDPRIGDYFLLTTSRERARVVRLEDGDVWYMRYEADQAEGALCRCARGHWAASIGAALSKDKVEMLKEASDG